MFIYSGSIKLLSRGVDEFFEGVLSCCLVVEDLLFQEVVEMLEKSRSAVGLISKLGERNAVERCHKE